MWSSTYSDQICTSRWVKLKMKCTTMPLVVSDLLPACVCFSPRSLSNVRSSWTSWLPRADSARSTWTVSGLQLRLEAPGCTNLCRDPLNKKQNSYKTHANDLTLQFNPVPAETLQPLHTRPLPVAHQEPGPGAAPPRPQPGVGSTP